MIFGIKNGQVLLGLKKRGHGEGYWNGFGGKRNNDETIEQSALREIKEEAGIIPTNLEIVGLIDFGLFDCHAFTFSDFKGELCETEEMKPRWFDINELPFDKMWEGDKIWFPLVLSGRKFEAKLVFEEKKLMECHITMKD